MKKMMSVVAVALFVAGSSAIACETCGCTAKKAEAACCSADKKCDKCTAEKPCKACTQKAAEKKAE